MVATDEETRARIRLVSVLRSARLGADLHVSLDFERRVVERLRHQRSTLLSRHGLDRYADHVLSRRRQHWRINSSVQSTHIGNRNDIQCREHCNSRWSADGELW